MPALDTREYFEDVENAVRIGIDAQKKYTFTNVRVTVAEDSSDGHTVSLQPVTKQAVTMMDGSTSYMDLPLLLDAPISFKGGGGVTTTHPVKKGDEGTATFSSQPIDAWHQQGGTQMQIDGRSHSLSDATYHPGGRSDPRKISNVSTDAGHTRSDDGKHTMSLHPMDGMHFKSVDPSDTSDNPYMDARKYFDSFIHPSDGHKSNAVDGDTTHSITNDHSTGPKLSAANGEHTVNAHPSDGVSIASSAAHTISAPNASLDKSGNLQNSGNHSVGKDLNVTQALSAASGSFGSFSFGGGGGGGGGGGTNSDGVLQLPQIIIDDNTQTKTIQTQGFTVAELNTAYPMPDPDLEGMRAHVTDADTPHFLTILAGGGMIKCPAFCDGMNWVAG